MSNKLTAEETKKLSERILKAVQHSTFIPQEDRIELVYQMTFVAENFSNQQNDKLIKEVEELKTELKSCFTTINSLQSRDRINLANANAIY